MANDADFVVVGAGFAGLSAALALEAAGARVIVLEARDRVGGRVESREITDGFWVDLGGQWIGPTQDRMYELVERFGIETFATYDEGDAIAIDGTKRYVYSGELPRLNPIVMADLAQAFLRFERMAKKVDLETPWTTPKANRYDGMTAESWFRSSLRTKQGRRLFRVFFEALFATEPSNISFLHALFYAKSGTDFDTLIRTTGGAQEIRFTEGSQGLANKMAQSLEGEIRFESPVRRIRQSSEGVVVGGDRGAVDARRVVVAIPPTLAGRIVYDPPLGGFRDQLMQRLPQGTVIKAMALYPEPFWRRSGLSGQAGGTAMAVGFTFDNSPPSGDPGVLVGFLEGHEAAKAGQMPPDARRKLVIDNFVAYFGAEAADPYDYVDRDWAAEEWTRGCYGAHFSPGVWRQFGPVLREPSGRIHWAGTETATKWNGYMDGAVSSGERAAAELLALS